MIMHIMHHSSSPWWAAHAVTVAAVPLAKIRLWPGRHSFSWEASVDAQTGTASSREVMLAPPRSYIHRQFQKVPQLTELGERQVWSDIIDKLEHYPQWLVRGAVTFGLFRAVSNAEGRGCSLQDRFFGINFLTFGSARSQRFSIQKTLPQGRHKDGKTTYIRSRVGDCTVTIPIVGGLLAMRKRKHSRGSDLGCLRFTVQHNEELEETLVTTEIRDYSPMLVGKKEPPPFLRKAAYLSTQSVVHAYVMWRFHKYCIHSEHSLPLHNAKLS